MGDSNVYQIVGRDPNVGQVAKYSTPETLFKLCGACTSSKLNLNMYLCILVRW